MTPSELTTRVTLTTAAAMAVVSATAVALGGGAAGLGVLVGGGLALVNFRWLARSVTALAAAPAGGVVGFGLGAVARFAASFAALAGVLASGAVHPVGVVTGLVLVPGVAVATALAGARTAG